MAYTYNIPQPSDALSISQPQILANFTALGAIGGNTNAASSALNTTAGFNFVYLPPQGSTPPITFPIGNIALYSANFATSGRNELFVNETNGVGLQQIPMTATDSNSWTYLPSGLIIQMGKVTITASTTGSGSFPITFPAKCIVATLQQVPGFPSGIAPAIVTSTTTTTINIAVTTSGTYNYNYIAIGR